MSAARKISSVSALGTDVPLLGAKSAAQLIAEAPAKFHRFIRYERLSRAEYVDGVAVGHVFLDAGLATLTTWEQVTAALARGEVWEG